MGVFDDVFGAVVDGPRETVAADPQFRESFPYLAAMMMDTPVIGKKRRTPSTLTMVCEDGQIKVGLRDRDHEMSLWVSAETLGGVFGALEEALREKPVRWRKSTYQRPNAR